jgi:hypothetical protein
MGMKASCNLNTNTFSPDDSWESDEVWTLLDQAIPPIASGRFIDDTLRAARLHGDVKPWWKRLFAPIPLTAFVGVTAAVTFSVISLFHSGMPASVSPYEQASTAQAASIQEVAATETLLVAADNLDKFSDKELVSLIGF